MLEDELMEFANKCKEAGLRVFLSEWQHNYGRREYFHASDGIGIVTVSNEDTNFGYFTLSIDYKCTKNFGCGCQIKDWEEWHPPKVKDVIEACAMRKAPEWLVQRVKREEFEKRAQQGRYDFYGLKLQPDFYKDVDEWLEAQKKWCQIIEL